MTQVQFKQLNNNIVTLTKEVSALRTALISLTTLGAQVDPEGEYKATFVKKVLKASKARPTHSYTGKGSLLKQIQKVK